LAGALVEMSLHTARPGLLLAGAVAFGLLALTARGTLGVVRVCGPRLHAALDVVVALALVVALFFRAVRPGTLGIVAVVVVCLLWLRVVTLTRFATPARHPTTQGAGAPSTPERPQGREAPVPSSKALARTMGLFAGRTVRRLPDPPDDVADRARQAGRQFRRVQQAWRARSRP
jgi:hypothetical protein